MDNHQNNEQDPINWDEIFGYIFGFGFFFGLTLAFSAVLNDGKRNSEYREYDSQMMNICLDKVKTIMQENYATMSDAEPKEMVQACVKKWGHS